MPDSPGEAAASRARRRAVARRALGGIVLSLAVVAAYLPAILDGGFVWDDDVNVTANRTLGTAAGLLEIWTENPVPPWYPLFHTALWLQFRLWGTEPLGYHLVNVLLHAANAVLVWRLLDRLGVRGAWLAAALWSLHPVQVESVAWITELRNVLSTTFCLGAAQVWIGASGLGHRSRPARAGAGGHVLALGLFLAALLTKTVTATLPPALVLIAWWKRGKLTRRDVTGLLPWFALALGFGLMTVFQERALGAVGADWAAGPLARLQLAGNALCFYAGRLAWPDTILFVYPRWDLDPWTLTDWLWPIVAAAVYVVVFALRKRIGHGPWVGLAFFALTLAPALGFFDVYYARYSPVADRWQYLASIGLIALAASAGAALVDGVGRLTRAAAVVPVVALLALLGWLTWTESRNYADAEVLWRATLAEEPRVFPAHNNLGALLLKRGELDEAERHFRAALALAPEFPYAHNNIGIVLQSRGRTDEAIEHFERAIAVRPNFVEALNSLGIALASKGRLDEAERRFSQAVEAAPGLVEARRNLGVLLLELGRADEAARQFRALAALDPELTEARLRLAETARALGETREAIGSYREALALEPDSAAAALGLAWLLATAPERELRDGAEAERLAEGVLERRGERDARAWDVLAAARAAQGRYDLAVEAAARASALAAEAGAARYAAEIEVRRARYAEGRP